MEDYLDICSWTAPAPQVRPSTLGMSLCLRLLAWPHLQHHVVHVVVGQPELPAAHNGQ